jgi:hypothetical protein
MYYYYSPQLLNEEELEIKWTLLLCMSLSKTDVNMTWSKHAHIRVCVCFIIGDEVVIIIVLSIPFITSSSTFRDRMWSKSKRCGNIFTLSPWKFSSIQCDNTNVNKNWD